MSAAPLVRLLLAALEDQADPDLSEIRATLKGWDFMADLDNRAVPILCHWLRIARERKLDPKKADRAEALAVMKDVAAEMRRLYGKVSVPMRDVQVMERGGEYPVAGAGGPASPVNPFTSLFLCSATRYRDGKWYVTAGAIWVMVLEFTSPPRVFTVTPFGASEDPSSPHFADQTALFSRRELKPFPFRDEDVEALSERSYRLALRDQGPR